MKVVCAENHSSHINCPSSNGLGFLRHIGNGVEKRSSILEKCRSKKWHGMGLSKSRPNDTYATERYSINLCSIRHGLQPSEHDVASLWSSNLNWFLLNAICKCPFKFGDWCEIMDECLLSIMDNGNPFSDVNKRVVYSPLVWSSVHITWCPQSPAGVGVTPVTQSLTSPHPLVDRVVRGF